MIDPRRTVPTLLLSFASLAVGSPGPDRGLTPPKSGKIRVAVAVSEGATVIDFAGPWEVFQDVMLTGDVADPHPFELYTVAETRETITASAGLKIVPDYTFADAPAPHVIVVGAQRGSPALHTWLRKVAGEADLTMSVCTGAFQLAAAGLLDGRKVTTHHDFYDRLAERYPRLEVQRDLRWVEGGAVATAGGLSSGIDLALRTVARYFGEAVAERTARYMEYGGEGWKPAGGLFDE